MFYAYVHQPGGCDYTIGCGNLLIELEGNTFDEAVKSLKEEIRERFTGDKRLEYAKILNVGGKAVIPIVNDIYDEIDEERSSNG